ncbi:MAG: SGNH/GDSL hydrolase family protein [Cyanobacteria bacterium J06648_16]
MAGATVIAASLTTAPVAHAASFGEIFQIYAFGDSYSENGNALEISTQAIEAGVPGSVFLPADPAFGLYDEDGRWTNGLTAVEVLAKNLQANITNYAVGGAKSGSGNFNSWLDPFQDTGFFGQIAQFEIEAVPADPDALYFVFISANDPFEFVTFGLPGSVEDLAAKTAENIEQGISELAALGAKQFLVVNSSDLDILPGVIQFGQVAEAQLFTDTFNDLLPNQLALLDQQLNIEIALYDHIAISDVIRANPEAYGLDNIVDPCQPVFPVEPTCNNPDEYYFWDEYHPTARVHDIIGNDMTTFVKQQTESVPEPSAVGALMLLGGVRILSGRRSQRIN